MKKWMDMSNLPQEFRERVERLERNFEVSTVIFKKFEPIFLDIFQNPYEETPRPQRSRKQRYGEVSGDLSLAQIDGGSGDCAFKGSCLCGLGPDSRD